MSNKDNHSALQMRQMKMKRARRSLLLQIENGQIMVAENDEVLILRQRGRGLVYYLVGGLLIFGGMIGGNLIWSMHTPQKTDLKLRANERKILPDADYGGGGEVSQSDAEQQTSKFVANLEEIRTMEKQKQARQDRKMRDVLICLAIIAMLIFGIIKHEIDICKEEHCGDWRAALRYLVQDNVVWVDASGPTDHLVFKDLCRRHCAGKI